MQWLLLGRFLAGFSAGGSFTLIPLYVSEISQDKIRGSLGAFFILSTNLGMLLMFICGNIFDYFATPKIMLLLPVVFCFLFSFFPETPIFLLRNDEREKAENSLTFLRGKLDEVNNELQKMITKVNNDEMNKHGSVMRGLRSYL